LEIIPNGAVAVSPDRIIGERLAKMSEISIVEVELVVETGGNRTVFWYTS